MNQDEKIDKQIDDYLLAKRLNKTVGKLTLLVIFVPAFSLVYIVTILYLIKWILL